MSSPVEIAFVSVSFINFAISSAITTRPTDSLLRICARSCRVQEDNREQLIRISSFEIRISPRLITVCPLKKKVIVVTKAFTDYFASKQERLVTVSKPRVRL